MKRAPLSPLFVAQHHDLVRRLVVHRATHICADRAWDVDDLLHDVLIALEHKQKSRRSRYSPLRGALSTYIWRVIGSVVARRIARQRCEYSYAAQASHAVREDELMIPSPDECGLEDEEAVRLASVLGDAAESLPGGASSIAYRTLVAWLLHDREAAALATMAGLPEVDVWRYVARVLSTLEDAASPEWQLVWHRHRAYASRRLRKARDEAQAARG